MSDTSDSARIERDLDETRSRLGSHLNELQDRLSPGQVLDDLLNYFRGSEGAAFGQNLLADVRAKPVPAAITGIGLAWLMASNPRTASTPSGTPPSSHLHHYGWEDHSATMSRIREAEQGVTRGTGETEEAYSARLDVARGQAIGFARHAQETTESFSRRVQDALAAASQSVSDSAGALRDQVSGAVQSVASAIGSSAPSAHGAAGRAGTALSQGGEAARQTGSNLLAALGDNPAILGALGLAAGALLGALVPQSEQEESALAGAARQARDVGTKLANQGVEGGKSVAQAVADRARESAGEAGLTGGKTPGQMVDAALTGDLASTAAEVAKDVLRTAEDAIRDQVSPMGSSPGESTSKFPNSSV